ncbi:DUF2891 family protein [Cellulomonas sp. zg-ZUI222]|uniref:DUF2891 family protein n=1 Tax=Cellulomonas TaxID=1707 RepID=UPI001A94577C|nr:MULTISPECIES: DUF2891 family protein [Cellulomonas]MBO0900935.1 DUF2891 family protein [Cellulomonas sp. zg-ZUI22]MBO0921590.1 DUF2891 family protein [Cellulomonas wangleii]
MTETSPLPITRYASVVATNLATPWPYHLVHLATGPDDVRPPADLYPAFHTSFDWHSCVHMHWLGVEVLRTGHEDTVLRARIDANLTAERVGGEVAYLRAHPAFERPYGWAWAARLAASCRAAADAGDEDAARWADATAPLADTVLDLAVPWLARIEHPVRHGVHSNTAFGLALLLTAADDLGRTAAARALRTHARRLYGTDRDWPARWERSGHDFLSPGLAEADLMARVLPADELRPWFTAFLPRPGEATSPARVVDPTDGHAVHLDGLNLSRAGALFRLARALDDPSLRDAGDRLLAAGLASLDNEDFVATHWLASFAWDAMTSR